MGGLTKAQKALIKFEGCLDHNFILQSATHDARQSSKIGVFSLLDLKNVFGGLPHCVIMKTFRWIGLDVEAVCLIKVLYDGCYTRICTSKGTTNPIRINAGVRQGCPLSPRGHLFLSSTLLLSQ
uniref:Reverse transcriptase domain-containing protein n=1 Tax=Panagrellus redivivus TaxID=6233 RepID=A0A7E4VU45_PANRE